MGPGKSGQGAVFALSGSGSHLIFPMKTVLLQWGGVEAVGTDGFPNVSSEEEAGSASMEK